MLSRLFAIVALLVSDPAWRPALPGYDFQFPRDHFEHPDFRTEWWYYTGNLFDAHGQRYGFELVFFRHGVNNQPQASVWGVRDLYLAHAALSSSKFDYSERLNRAGPGIAGASRNEQRVWNGNWSLKWTGSQQTLDAVSDKFRFHLELEPVKPVVIHGANGVSNGAHYVSFPRLRVAGTVNATPVTGQAWMDHEWFTALTASGGWNWFSVQLENGTELMLAQLLDGRGEGTFVDKAGKGHYLRGDEFTLEPLERWNKYPVKWRIRIPSLGIDVECKALLNAQRLVGSSTYWEGAVTYSGSHRGLGYLEMTGYEK